MYCYLLVTCQKFAEVHLYSDHKVFYAPHSYQWTVVTKDFNEISRHQGLDDCAMLCHLIVSYSVTVIMLVGNENGMDDGNVAIVLCLLTTTLGL